jgi:hypothetical protein
MKMLSQRVGSATPDRMEEGDIKEALFFEV